jgi:hypothetical protein
MSYEEEEDTCLLEYSRVERAPLADESRLL